MQSTQMFLGVAIVLLGNAQSLSQIIKFKLCFVVILLLLTLLGAVIGCIRTFRRLSLFAMFSVYGIAAVCIITMVADSRSYPYFGDGTPVKTEAIRHGVDFQTQLIAAMNMVNAYGGQSISLFEPYFPGGLTFALRPAAADIQIFTGAVLFVELMAEMKNPRDFWKSLLMAGSIIMGIYLTFGMYVYSQQGQLTYIPAVQGIGAYAPRTAGNTINIIVHVVAAAMYGNVCLKSIYYPLIIDKFHGPSLNSPRGHRVWSGMAFILWIGAFLIASAIPNFGDLVGVVASLFVIQYTFTLPAFFFIAHQKQLQGLSWSRAFGKQWWNTLFIIAALVATLLGTYSSIRGMVLDVRDGRTPTAFSCRSPAQPK
jgi:hypothetical protein